MNRDLEQARNAYNNRDVELSKAAHGPSQQAELYTEHQKDERDPLKNNAQHIEKHSSGGNYLRSAVYGGMDGMMTTFTIVTSALGASFSVHVILTLGISNMIADGLAMGLGDYLSTKSEQEFLQQEKEREKWEIENNHEGEVKEMIELYKTKGLDPTDAETITKILAKYKDAWLDIMMLEELELGGDEESPIKNALVTFFAFELFGLVPLIPYIVGDLSGMDDQLFLVSLLMTIVALIVIGVGKSFFVYSPWWMCTLETLVIGACTASSSYGIGKAFEGI
ncbi:hypothetical protein pb186bvf_005944 [Paramecium bursaria]